jgi:hypothetical protein
LLVLTATSQLITHVIYDLGLGLINTSLVLENCVYICSFDMGYHTHCY